MHWTLLMTLQGHKYFFDFFVCYLISAFFCDLNLSSNLLLDRPTFSYLQNFIFAELHSATSAAFTAKVAAGPKASLMKHSFFLWNRSCKFAFSGGGNDCRKRCYQIVEIEKSWNNSARLHCPDRRRRLFRHSHICGMWFNWHGWNYSALSWRVSP